MFFVSFVAAGYLVCTYHVTSGSTCKQGEAEIATGVNTFFGRVASLVGKTIMLQVTCRKFSHKLALSALLLLAYSSWQKYSSCTLDLGTNQRRLNNILVLLIGGIPIAITTVLSVTLAVGATQLVKYKSIVT